MIKAEVIKDSRNVCTGDRLTTFVLTYPRFIHSELMTHRVFSRNAASSRAIPVEKMIKGISENPVLPVEWGKNQRGMQAKELLDEEATMEAEFIWLNALQVAIDRVERLLVLGVHKQIANRLLEPWAHMTTIVTATEYGNFFRLRAHPDAQPEFQRLAYTMLEVYSKSTPDVLEPGEWHLPFDYPVDWTLNLETRRKVCTARVARVSYLNIDGKSEVEQDVILHDRLLEAGHMSPFEHCAAAEDGSHWSSNFKGWYQYRKMVERPEHHYSLSDEEIEHILARRPS